MYIKKEYFAIYPEFSSYVKRGKIESIIKQFENSPLNQKIKTWQLFIIPILIIAFFILLVVMFR